jgi:hypothetical protein
VRGGVGGVGDFRAPLLKSEWRKKESGKEELILFSLSGEEEKQHAGEAVRKAQALMATTLAHCAEVQGREAELQQELGALRQRASMTQKPIMDYINVTAPKEAAAEKKHADTVRFASEPADETEGLATRVAELKSENDRRQTHSDILAEDLGSSTNAECTLIK